MTLLFAALRNKKYHGARKILSEKDAKLVAGLYESEAEQLYHYLKKQGFEEKDAMYWAARIADYPPDGDRKSSYEGGKRNPGEVRDEVIEKIIEPFFVQMKQILSQAKIEHTNREMRDVLNDHSLNSEKKKRELIDAMYDCIFYESSERSTRAFTINDSRRLAKELNLEVVKPSVWKRHKGWIPNRKENNVQYVLRNAHIVGLKVIPKRPTRKK